MSEIYDACRICFAKTTLADINSARASSGFPYVKAIQINPKHHAHGVHVCLSCAKLIIIGVIELTFLVDV